MIRVVYDYQVFWWQEYGGISRYIYELASHLAESNELDVKILGLINVNQYLKQCNPGLAVSLNVPKIKRTGNIVKKLDLELSKILLKLNQPDIIHETYYQPQKLAPKSTKVVVTVHDMVHEKFSQFYPNDSLPQEKAEAVKRADHIICVSENTKQDLMEILNITPDKISVIYHGTSLKLNENHQFERKITQPYIFYVGERGRYKNFHRLLQAYVSSAQLRNNFKLVCFGGPLFSVQELSLFSQMGLPEDQVLRVSGDDAALSNFYQGASVFVFPSLYEGFGIPLLEAMSLGCPIVCSQTSCLPEIVGNAAEFFNPYETESIANALQKVLKSSDKAENLVKLGTERVKNFSWKNCAEQTKSVYQSLV